MHVFKHPKYYEEFRQRAKRAQKKLRERNISDQVISKESSTEENQRAPGPGLKQQATSTKPQAPSCKRQASSSKRVKQQATSLKPQAASFKLQAASVKLQDSRTTVKFHGTRTEGLDHDKCIVWMLHMEANLVW